MPSRARRRWRWLAYAAVAAVGTIALYDVVVFRWLAPLPTDYCRVTEDALAPGNSPGLAANYSPGDLRWTTSGCLNGEDPVCRYNRIVLPPVDYPRYCN